MRSPPRARRFPGVDVALCLPATLIERAARAVPGFAIGAPGRPFRRKGRTYRLHVGGDAQGCRREADHRRPFRAARGPARERRRGQGQGRGGACPAGLGVILCVGESLDGARGRRGGRDGRRRSSRRRCPQRSPTRRGSRSPTSRSGRSAPARSRPWTKSPRCTRRCASGWSPPMATRAARSASSTAARSRPSNAARDLRA